MAVSRYIVKGGNMLQYIVFAVLIIFMTSPMNAQERARPASMLQLIATPERFDGKAVIVFGFVVLNDESSTLFFRSDDYQHSLLADAIALDRNELLQKEKNQVNLTYVRLSGVFHAVRTGAASGRITNIDSCTVWSDPAHPRIKRDAELIERQHMAH